MCGRTNPLDDSAYASWGSCQRRTEISTRDEASESHRQPGKDIWLMGGGEIIASFLDEQAIDEFVISVAPVFIGEGIPLIARRHRHVPLELRSIERFEDGLVQLRYSVQNKQS